MTIATVGRARPRYIPPAWLAGSLAATVAGLWLIQTNTSLSGTLSLRLFTAQLTASMLAAIELPVAREATILVHAGGFACEIDVACTALLPAELLTAVMLAWRFRFIALVLGVLLMICVNQLRLVSLVWLGVYAPGYFDLAHAVLWPPLLLLAGAGYLAVWLRATRR
jgi:exosortase/archaeosortase family protein